MLLYVSLIYVHIRTYKYICHLFTVIIWLIKLRRIAKKVRLITVSQLICFFCMYIHTSTCPYIIFKCWPQKPPKECWNCQEKVKNSSLSFFLLIINSFFSKILNSLFAWASFYIKNIGTPVNFSWNWRAAGILTITRNSCA